MKAINIPVLKYTL